MWKGGVAGAAFDRRPGCLQTNLIGLKTNSRRQIVTDLRGPPSEHTQTEKLQDLKKLAQYYAHDQGSCDDVQISYLETLEEHNNDNLRLAQMISR
jgi:hypothetical protein